MNEAAATRSSGSPRSPGSLRTRLLIGALAWIIVALALAGWGLRNLFKEHIEQQLQAVFDAAGKQAFAGAVVAYEPVWAIGTGRTASPQQAQAVHAFIRGEIAARDAIIADSLPLLYGGSVKPDNAASLFAQADVDGGLIGGASLVAADFLAIVAAAAA